MSVILGIKVETTAGALGGEGRKILRGIAKQTLHETATHWHEEILQRHFRPSARARYQHEPRTKGYLRRKRREGVGKGRYIDLIFSGKSRRYLMAFATITGSGRQQTIRMKPPWYFVIPFKGHLTDQAGLYKNRNPDKPASRQPDKPAELTRVHSGDTMDLREFGAKRTELMLQSEKYNPAKVINFTGR